MDNIIFNANQTLTKATDTITKINGARLEKIQEIITETLQAAKENKAQFNTKKNAIAAYLKEALGNDVKPDNYTKRAVAVAKLILIDGYKIKTDLLTLSQIEQLCSFKKEVVNGIIDLEDEAYIEQVKELIKLAKVEKTTKIFSKKIAKEIDAL